MMTNLQKARKLLDENKRAFDQFVEDNRDKQVFSIEHIHLWTDFMTKEAMPRNRKAAYHLGFVYPSWDVTPAVVAEFFWYVASYNELIQKWENGDLDPAYHFSIGRRFPSGLTAFLATE